MAGFKTQIKARFKAKYPKVNLSAKKLDAIISKLDDKTESDDEAEIDAKLDAINDFTPFEEMAREEDRIRDLETKAKGKTEPEPKPTDEPDPKPDDAPAWFKAYTEKVDAELNAIKGEKTIAGRKATLTEKLKDAPESFRNAQLKAFNRMNFTNDEEFNEFLIEIEADATVAIQEQSNAGLGKDKPARSGGGLDKKLATDKELDAVIGNLKI